MKPVQFISNSPKVNQIIKGLTLTKSLFITSLIYGEPHIGKKSLVQSIFPKSIFIDGSDHQALLYAIKNQDEVVVYNFSFTQDILNIDFTNKRVIAISDSIKNIATAKGKFAFIYRMPALKDRAEDVPMLAGLFKDSIQQELMIDASKSIAIEELDISENIKSLKASIYRQLAMSDLAQDELEKLIYDYLYERIQGNNTYREQISLFERPLIKAGLDRYRSQLKLAEVLGINRNTLRKKIYEHNIQ